MVPKLFLSLIQGGKFKIFYLATLPFMGDGFRQLVRDCIKVADYTLERFREMKWNAWKNKYSTTVVFNRPSMKLIEKYQLAAYRITGTVLVFYELPNYRYGSGLLWFCSERNIRNAA